MSEDEDKSKDELKRTRNERQRKKEFRRNRQSYVSDVLIKMRENSRSAEEKVSLRRKSRAFSTEIDPRDIINPQSRITLEWKDLRYEVVAAKGFMNTLRRKPNPTPKVLLQGLNGIVRPGEIMGIMGPSGCGKSIFMNILAGRITGGTVKGEILVNGYERNSNWSHVVSFVEQDTGYLDPRLTVRELLEYTADLTVPKKYKVEEREARIQHAMRMVEISHISDSVIGGNGVKGISGGERRRLAIALELLQEPKVMFLDEPTSGLDAKTAVDIVRFLYQLAVVDDLCIIMSVHQPRMSILSKFHQVLLMAEGGTICSGTVDDIIEFLASHGYACPNDENPADFFLQCLREPADVDDNSEREDASSENPINLLKAEWKKVERLHKTRRTSLRSNASDEYKPTKPERNLGRAEEFMIVARRYFRSVSRDKSYFFATNLLLIIPTLLGIAVFFQIPDDGFGAVQNRIGLISALPRDGTATSLMTAFVFANAYNIRRERYRYMARSSTYYWALICIQFPLWIGSMTLCFIVQYYVSGLRYTPFTALLIFLSFYILIALQGFAAGVIFASFTDNIQIALTVGAFSSYFVWFFNGLTVNTNNVSWVLRWIRYIAPTFYLHCGLVQNEFDGQILNGQPGEFWTNLYALNVVSVLWSAGALTIITVVFLFAGQLALKYRTNPAFKV